MSLSHCSKLVGLTFVFSALVTALTAQAEVEPVPYVDLNRYLGTWYEIASIPQSFQKQCVSDTQAKYSEAELNTIEVQNTCKKADGSTSSAEGRAKVVDDVSNAKLKVTFVKILGNWIYLFGGKYWIIDLHPDYDYAVVGHPKRTYGWILSRTPSLDHNLITTIAANLTTQGYDLCAFNMTNQDGGFSGARTRLCDYLKLP
jgi:apolipoprotein D and lipocalin family protein